MSLQPDLFPELCADGREDAAHAACLHRRFLPKLGDRSPRAVADLSLRDAYNLWRRCRAQLKRTDKSHHNRRSARKAFVWAMKARLDAGVR